MTEAVAAKPSPTTERVKIAYIDRKGGKIRLVHKTGQNTSDNCEYDLPAGSDERFKSGDYVDATILGEKLQSLAYPSGAEPEEPKRVQDPPKHETSKTSKKIPPHISLIGKGFVIISGTLDGDQRYTLVENALKYIHSFKEGDLVNFSCQGKDKIKSMWKVDENGERPPKKEYNQSAPIKTLTIGGTINLENYENIKIEISGPFNGIEDAKKLKEEFREVALLFGENPITKDLINRYIKRVCGGQ